MRGYQLLLLVLTLFLVAAGLWQFYLQNSEQPPSTPAEELWQAVGNMDVARTQAILAEYPKYVGGTDEFGRTLLHHAVRQGRDDSDTEMMIGLLIQLGGDVNATDRSGQTPLHVAAHAGSPKVAQVLMDALSDIHAKDDRGRTPLDVAQEFRLDQLTDIGKDHRIKSGRLAVARVIEAQISKSID
ncbi:MAG: ankyrin repeat domain-containing protein [Pirellulales bacterium]|nr:ankyrin repeat domain-containing protein [Pirellulales bacterium]